MPIYECNEYQFVENVRRLIETSQKFIINRRITVHDDAKYGPAILPEEEFHLYEKLCIRRSVNSTVTSRVPFIDSFHRNRMHGGNEILHAASNLVFPRMSIPYCKVEYSLNIWGGTYLFTFDALFKPEIVIEKRNLRTLGGKGALIHLLRYNPPQERVMEINLPKEVTVFDVRNMIRVIDYSSNF